MTWTGTTGTGTVVLSTSPTFTGPVTITRTTGLHLNIVATNANASSYMNFNNSNTGGTCLIGVDGGSYAGISNGATLLGSWSNHPLIFATNAAQRMRITATGDVGINTTTPTERFEVNGNIRSGLVKRTPSVQQQVISSPTPLPNNSPLPVVNWTSLFGDGESLTYNNATGTFTNNLNRNIAVTVSFACSRTGPLGASNYHIQRNTGSEKWGLASGPGADMCTGTATLFLANTDYFRIIAYQDSGFGQDVDEGTLTYVIH